MELTVTTAIDVQVLCVFSRLLSAAETWTIRITESRRLWYLKLLLHENTETVLEGQLSTRLSRERNRLDKAEEAETTRIHL